MKTSDQRRWQALSGIEWRFLHHPLPGTHGWRGLAESYGCARHVTLFGHGLSPDLNVLYRDLDGLDLLQRHHGVTLCADTTELCQSVYTEVDMQNKKLNLDTIAQHEAFRHLRIYNAGKYHHALNDAFYTLMCAFAVLMYNHEGSSAYLTGAPVPRPGCVKYNDAIWVAFDTEYTIDKSNGMPELLEFDVVIVDTRDKVATT
ncbi:hypothetical protein E8E13_006118 [Curvularia kusanoi]|uniref:Uncharacterized protein n=1 Tax=Curvularia kusanoi TaxID=90978 RepID=A0A9P4TFN3_CURKU|nr:hypothetical protein E8E13_006118 [Curvularia kusanoi]